ncbi:MAG: hypothetical protein COB02_03490 [Candidatus Cloacimonadota bacterium]|nr:MAG: hypothetical protein COB02_03490 [Candidatus Cloacimonadota bacterium]
MRFRLNTMAILLALSPGMYTTWSSSSLEEGLSDRLFEKHVKSDKQRIVRHSKVDLENSPFVVSDQMRGVRTPKMMRRTMRGEVSQYHTDFYAKPVEIGDEVSIMRTSMTRNLSIKTSYDKKGNIVAIHAWKRDSGQALQMSLDVLAEPIVKDEIESSVAKLRIVYNAYGEVISKAAWNKITGEKIAVPASVPFTNYVNEDKYWAHVERQKLFDRNYEDLYVDRGHVATRRMKKIVRHDNPFGVPEEVVVYEERPIIERHYEDAHYRADAKVGVFSATMSGGASSKTGKATFKDSSATHFEVSVDADIFGQPIEVGYTNMSNKSTLSSATGFTFDNKAYLAGSSINTDLSQFDFTLRREFRRSEEGDFGINWLFSIKYLDMDLSIANAATKSRIKGQAILPQIGIEVVKNMTDHIDLHGYAKYFSLSDTTLSEGYFGGKYYFHPENVDEWRASLGYKFYDLTAKNGTDEFNLKQSGLKVALERSF